MRHATHTTAARTPQIQGEGAGVEAESVVVMVAAPDLLHLQAHLLKFKVGWAGG